MMQATRRRLLLGGLGSTLLAGCGFQLRGAPAMPFQSIYLGTGEYSELTAALRRQLEAGGTQVVANAAEAEVQLQVLKDTRAREITSMNSSGKVREFELRRFFDFRLTQRGGGERIPIGKIAIKRTLTYDDNDLLAKEGEEALLYKDMDSDLVRQLLRRLAAAKPVTA
jgi:LPS-assembly lipoprotein